MVFELVCALAAHAVPIVSVSDVLGPEMTAVGAVADRSNSASHLSPLQEAKDRILHNDSMPRSSGHSRHALAHADERARCRQRGSVKVIGLPATWA